jgi:hypothetical protein
MVLAASGILSRDDMLEMYPDMSHDVFYLSAAHHFRVRFGVFLGENISSPETMNAGDIYQISYDANWIEVFRLSESKSTFSLPLPMRADLYTLEPYAYLIFMSDSGQTFDLWPVRVSGVDHIITNAPFRFCEEYTLIEIHKAPAESAILLAPDGFSEQNQR